jgi:hypothetical protein
MILEYLSNRGLVAGHDAGVAGEAGRLFGDNALHSAEQRRTVGMLYGVGSVDTNVAGADFHMAMAAPAAMPRAKTITHMTNFAGRLDTGQSSPNSFAMPAG